MTKIEPKKRMNEVAQAVDERSQESAEADGHFRGLVNGLRGKDPSNVAAAVSSHLHTHGRKMSPGMKEHATHVHRHYSDLANAKGEAKGSPDEDTAESPHDVPLNHKD